MKPWYDLDRPITRDDMNRIAGLENEGVGEILMLYLHRRCLDLMETVGFASGPETQESVWSNRGKYQAYREIMDLISPPKAPAEADTSPDEVQ